MSYIIWSYVVPKKKAIFHQNGSLGPGWPPPHPPTRFGKRPNFFHPFPKARILIEFAISPSSLSCRRPGGDVCNAEPPLQCLNLCSLTDFCFELSLLKAPVHKSQNYFCLKSDKIIIRVKIFTSTFCLSNSCIVKNGKEIPPVDCIASLSSQPGTRSNAAAEKRIFEGLVGRGWREVYFNLWDIGSVQLVLGPHTASSRSGLENP